MTPGSPSSRLKVALQGWLFYLVFCCLMFSAIVCAFLSVFYNPVSGLATFCLLLTFATMAWTKAEERLGFTLDDVSQWDKRAPVLFLRPFEEDSLAIIESVDPLLSPSGRREVPLDEVLRPLNAIGPLVSIRRPGLGQLRVGYTEQPGDNEWQSKVQDWLEEAGLVVLVLGDSPGIEWEIEQIAKSTPLESLLIFLPPGWQTTFLSGVRRAKAEKVDYEKFTQLLEKYFHVTLPPVSNSVHFIGFDATKHPVLPTSVIAPENWEDNYLQDWSNVDRQLREVLAKVLPDVNFTDYREYGYASRVARRMLAGLLYTISLFVAAPLVFITLFG